MGSRKFGTLAPKTLHWHRIENLEDENSPFFELLGATQKFTVKARFWPGYCELTRGKTHESVKSHPGAPQVFFLSILNDRSGFRRTYGYLDFQEWFPFWLAEAGFDALEATLVRVALEEKLLQIIPSIIW